MKHLFFIFSIIIFSSFSFAQNFTLKEAERISHNFLKEKGVFRDNNSYSLKLAKTERYDNNVIYYIFELEEGGFIIVSASDKTHPILGYSLENPFIENPAVKDLLNGVKEQILFAEKNHCEAWPSAKKQWLHYTMEEFQPKTSKNTAITPLLTTRWNQDRYYNTYCPWDIDAGYGYDYRVPNGCVALCMAVLMDYHRFPEQGVGGVSYTPSPYPRQTVNLREHTYNYDAMHPKLPFYSGETAKLIYHAGVTTQMGYHYSGSGAVTEVAVRKMVDHFNYSGAAKSVNAEIYPDSLLSSYITLLMDELKARRPILYSGRTPDNLSGHAFMLDGFDTDSLFHVNWGWGGAANGYYRINRLIPTGGNFSYKNNAYLEIYPKNSTRPSCEGHRRNEASFGTIASSSGYLPYLSGPNASWMIAASGATSYTFSIDMLSLNPEIDYVTIYNGPFESSGIAQRFTGSSTSFSPFTVNADSVLITFTSTDPNATNNSYYGFKMSYTSTLSYRYCDEITHMPYQTVGKISDNSPYSERYLPQTFCSWLLDPAFITGFVFNFDKFDLKHGDFIDIYDASQIPEKLWKRFDIYNAPTGEAYNFPYQKMKINFISDNWLEGEGFEISFHAVLGIDENEELNDISIFPNPASDFVSLSFSSDTPDNIQYRILDLSGKILQEHQFYHSGGDYSQRISVSGLASGFYLMHIQTSKGKAIRKFLIH